MAVFAEPLELVFVAVGAEAEVLSDARVKPADGVWETESAERLDAVAVAQADKAGASAGTFIEGEDESTVEAGGVVGAGGVGEMVVEAEDAAAAGEDVTELLQGGVRI